MKTIEITRKAIVVEPKDWDILQQVYSMFRDNCNPNYCDSCPLQQFCAKHESPANYIRNIMNYLDD